MEALAADSVLVVQVAAEVLRRIASTLHPRAVLVVVVLGSSITQEHLVYLDKETLVVQDETIVVTIQAAVAAVAAITRTLPMRGWANTRVMQCRRHW